MSVVKHITNRGKAVRILEFTFFSLICTTLLLWYFFFRDQQNWTSDLLLICGVVIPFLLFPLMFLVLARLIRCPDCSRILRAQKLKQDQTHTYFCAKCDVIWDTCIPVGED